MTDYPIKSPRKLIEVALPLDAINVACAYEKMPGIGAHPRGIHLWWARRPLAAARAVIFSQLVNDPSWKWELENPGQIPPGHLKASWAASRKRLFAIIEDLVQYKNTADENILQKARSEIQRSWREACNLNKDHPQASILFDPDNHPGLHDPFAGGGAIPLEAQRLGLNAAASDLNPVAVLINKAMIEFPSKFVGRSPVSEYAKERGHKTKGKSRQLPLNPAWRGVKGLAADIRYYGQWMQDEAEKRIGHFYQPIEITSEMAEERPDLRPLIGQKLTVIAWLWARTVKSPNPAYSDIDVPLVASFMLSTKPGKEVYIEPLVVDGNYRFKVRLGKPTDAEAAKSGTKLSRGANFKCLMSGTPISPEWIRSEFSSNRRGERLMAVVAKVPRGRVYLPPTTEIENIARKAKPNWHPNGALVQDARAFTPTIYGMKNWSDLFTSRQLTALTTFSDLLRDTRERIKCDAISGGLPNEGAGLAVGGTGATAYAEAVCTYLAFAISRLADFGCSLSTWKPSGEQVMHLFTRQAVAMTWDFPESNLLGDSSICWLNAVKYTAEGLEAGDATSGGATGIVFQADAQTQTISRNKFISTDPPYYDNVPYADLSDFFYVWLRGSLRDIFPDLFATLAVPKDDELVATTYRHGSYKQAESFFLAGMTQVIRRLAEFAHPEGPITIYYAFKQQDSNSDNGTSSTGWETFLEAILTAGFAIVGTWPLRSEQEYRIRGMGSNALASSIVLVCRKRLSDATTISRRQFIRELNETLPIALDTMTRESEGLHSPVAPVDLSQAIIGPGIAVFSKYAAVLEADGSPMSVRTALQLINRFLAEDDFDPDTQFCLHWFEQHGWTESVFGEADVLARSKSTSVDAMKEAGVLKSGSGKVRLLNWAEYPTDWDPRTDKRTPVWEALHQLIRAHKQGGDTSAGALLTALGGKAEAVRQLAYRLYTVCERLGQAEDARAYNELITSWTGIETAANSVTKPAVRQGSLFED